MSFPNASYAHVGSTKPLCGNTIPEHLLGIVGRFAARDAVVSIPQSERLTYGELHDRADAVARGLVGLGFSRGDRVGIWSPNNIQWLLVQLATARLGIVLVNLNPGYRQYELEYALTRARVQALITIPSYRSSNYLGMLVDLIPELDRQWPVNLRTERFPDLRSIVVFDPRAPSATTSPHRGVMDWQSLLAAGATTDGNTVDAITASLDPDDPVNIQYTSGTTGAPKAVVLTHHNILNNALAIAEVLDFTADDRLCLPVPFYHCFGMIVGNLMTFASGGCLILPSETFDPLEVLRAIERERATVIYGVPTMFIAELEDPSLADYDLTSLRTGIMAGAPCQESLLRRVATELHCPEIVVGYGQTEASPVTHMTRRDAPDALRFGSVGVNLPHQEAKVVDVESGRTAPRGCTGELCFRGYHVMRGYYEDPEATREAIDATGWLHSGDLGTMDDNGYVRITGRIKDMIIRGGENIYPAEIEEILAEHPAIADAAVIGVPDDYYGEEVMACIQLHRDAIGVSDEAIIAFCRERLTHFKVPKHIWRMDEFPMTVTGKVQKFRLRELAREHLASV